MPGQLTIVGLGPGDRSLRTLATQRELDNARRIILRTAVHPGLQDLDADPRVTTCDDLYQSGQSFEAVYQSIVNRVIEAAHQGPVVYAVPGHPRVGEATVSLILERLDPSVIDLKVLDAVSAIDSTLTQVGVDILSSEVQIRDALALAAASEEEPFASGRIEISPTRGVLVLQLYSSAIASAVKLSLTRLYPEEHIIAIVSGANGVRPGSVKWCPLHELDHHEISHLSTLWIPPLADLAAVRSIASLQRIIARLRAPGGCPWDREQSHLSLRAALIEEAYEVLDAIDANDPEALAEELGDLLFQPIMHAQIAEEMGDFTFEDIVEQATRKLIRRHPHVFGDLWVDTSDDVIKTWEAIKKEERELTGTPAETQTGSRFDRLPRSMPATTRIASVIDDKKLAVSPDDRSVAADLVTKLFQAVVEVTRAGLDPEFELDREARRQLGSTAVLHEQGS